MTPEAKELSPKRLAAYQDALRRAREEIKRRVDFIESRPVAV